MVRIISGFRGDYRFLSNFYPSEVEYQGIVYPTVEHAYQAAKTFNLQDRQYIAKLATPREAKQAGRAIKMRPDWNHEKLKVMKRLVLQKFQKHEDLKRKLLDTDKAFLVETNWWNDTFWGVCGGVGENNLGIILMAVRNELRFRGKRNES